MTQSTRSASLAYLKSDFYTESIYLMKTQELKNLEQLDQSDILLTSSFSSQRSFNEKMLVAQLDGNLKLHRNVLIKSYAAATFKRIRKVDNINDEEFFDSIDPSKNIKNIQNAGEGAGASGSFFFFSNDQKYLMKTMSMKEI